jgi:hypothetical protein
MPFVEEHAGRLIDPKEFKNFRRKELANGVDAIYGIRSNGKTEIQSLRFDSSKFTETQAKAWMKDNNFNPILFEPSIGRENKMAEDLKLNEEEVEVKEKEDKEEEKVMEKDVYATAEEAEKRAEEMGGKGSHEMKLVVEDEEKVMYMPFPTHDEYEQALKEEEEAKMEEDKKEEKMEDDKEEKMKDDDEDEDKEKYNSQLDCDCPENKPNCDCDKTETSARNHNVETTFNLEGVEIFSEGIWNGDEYTKKDLNSMVENFDETGFQPPLKLGHNEEQPEMLDGAPALGYVDKIYIDGKKLLANFVNLPKKVYEAIKRGNYKRVSSEIYWNYKSDGKSLDRVLKAVALLGSEIPAVTNLESISGLYNKNAEFKFYLEKENQDMDTENKVDIKEFKNLQEQIAKLKEEKAVTEKELNDRKIQQRAEKIAAFVSYQKEVGKVLPAFEKQLVALLETTNDEKVYSYTVEEKTIELSQFELVESIIESLPKLVEFAEISESGEFVVDRLPYTNAGDEVDRRAKLYIKHGKASKYSEALDLVLKDDETLKAEYEGQK